MDRFAATRAWGPHQLKLGLLACTVSIACALPTWAEAPAIRIENIQARPAENAIILDMSAPVEASLSQYDKDGQHRIVIDMQGVDIESIKNKVEMLQQMGQVPCVKKVTFSSFRGPDTELVRMVIETRQPDTTGLLSTSGDRELVLHLNPGGTPQSATPEQAVTPPVSTPQPEQSAEAPHSQPKPAVVPSEPPSSAASPGEPPAHQPDLAAATVPPPSEPAPQTPEATGTGDLQGGPTESQPASPEQTAAAPATSKIEPKPNIKPPATGKRRQPQPPRGLQPTRIVHRPQPTPIPAATQTPPEVTDQNPTEAVITSADSAPPPQPMPDTLSDTHPTPTFSSPPPEPGNKGLIDTLQAKTSLVVDKVLLDVKSQEADGLRKERNQLLDDKKRLDILLGQRDLTIRQLRESNAELEKKIHDTHALSAQKRDMEKTAEQLRTLQKSYDEMKHNRELAEKQNTDLNKQVEDLQQKLDVTQKKLDLKEKFPLPSEALEQAKARGELLNSLSSLSDNDVQELVYAEQHYRNAKEYQLQGDMDKAILEYRRARSHAPQVKTYGLELANIYFQRHDYVSARAVLNAIYQFNKSDPEVLNELGKAAFMQKDDKAAMEYFRQAMPIGILNNYASALKQQDRLEEAEAIYKIAVGLHPEDSDLQFNLGNLYPKQDMAEIYPALKTKLETALAGIKAAYQADKARLETQRQALNTLKKSLPR